MNDPEQRFFDEVRAAVSHVDPVPPNVLEAARAAFCWRSVDAELAELIYDSSEQSLALASVRGGSSLRLLTFESDEVSLDLQVVAEGERRTIIGELGPEQPAEIQVLHADGMTRVHTDERGRFRVDRIVTGAVSLRCRLLADADRIVTTNWLTV